MHLSSVAFEANKHIPHKYAKQGDNISPPLTIADVPALAKSLALICHDPDAPRDDGFTHWVVWNLPPNTKEVAENKLPAGAIQGLTDWGSNQWGGPQPPSGTHRYNFYLYALDSELDIPESTNRNRLEHAISGHVLATAELTGLYTAE